MKILLLATATALFLLISIAGGNLKVYAQTTSTDASGTTIVTTTPNSSPVIVDQSGATTNRDVTIVPPPLKIDQRDSSSVSKDTLTKDITAADEAKLANPPFRVCPTATPTTEKPAGFSTLATYTIDGTASLKKLNGSDRVNITIFNDLVTQTLDGKIGNSGDSNQKAINFNIHAASTTCEATATSPPFIPSAPNPHVDQATALNPPFRTCPDSFDRAIYTIKAPIDFARLDIGRHDQQNVVLKIYSDLPKGKITGRLIVDPTTNGQDNAVNFSSVAIDTKCINSAVFNKG